MTPLPATIHWIACTIEVQEDLEAEPIDLEELIFDLPDVLLAAELGFGESAEVVFRMRVRERADPYYPAVRTIAHAATATGRCISITSLRSQTQEQALAAVRSWPCAGCGRKHEAAVCASCEDCLQQAAEQMLDG